MKAINIIETAYRATLEEQDDTIVWITHAMKGAGADLAVLLRGNAANYAVSGQDASGLRFGAVTQAHPPDIAGDIAGLIGKGVDVYLVEEDATERGIETSERIDGVQSVPRAGIAELLSGYDRIWHW